MRFLKIYDWMFGLGLSPNDIIFYSEIYNYTQIGCGLYRGAVGKFCDRLSISRRTAYDVIKRLETKGLIVDDGGMYISCARERISTICDQTASGNGRRKESVEDDNNVAIDCIKSAETVFISALDARSSAEDTRRDVSREYCAARIADNAAICAGPTARAAPNNTLNKTKIERATEMDYGEEEDRTDRSMEDFAPDREDGGSMETSQEIREAMIQDGSKRSVEIDVEKFISWWNKECRNLPPIRDLTRRQEGLLAKLHHTRTSTETAKVFKKANDNLYLNGRSKNSYSPVGIDKMLNEEFFRAVESGKYDRSKKGETVCNKALMEQREQNRKMFEAQRAYEERKDRITKEVFDEMEAAGLDLSVRENFDAWEAEVKRRLDN